MTNTTSQVAFCSYCYLLSISQPYKEIFLLPICYEKAEKFKSCLIAHVDHVEFQCGFPEPQNQCFIVLSHAVHFHEDRTTWQILGQEIIQARVEVSLRTLRKLAEQGSVGKRWEDTCTRKSDDLGFQEFLSSQTAVLPCTAVGSPPFTCTPLPLRESRSQTSSP